MNGWDVDILDQAVQGCNAESGVIEECTVLDLYTTEEMNECVLPPAIDEPITGFLDALPGCNPIQPGPDRAVKPADCVDNAKIGPRKSYGSDMSELGWQYVGCATYVPLPPSVEFHADLRSDSNANRVLPHDRLATQDMTIEKCIEHCSSKGHVFAGTQWSEECWCGGTFDASTLGSNSCTMTCKGDESQYCGNGERLSVYKKLNAKVAAAPAERVKRHANAHKRAVL